MPSEGGQLAPSPHLRGPSGAAPRGGQPVAPPTCQSPHKPRPLSPAPPLSLPFKPPAGRCLPTPSLPSPHWPLAPSVTPRGRAAPRDVPPPPRKPRLLLLRSALEGEKNNFKMAAAARLTMGARGSPPARA